MFTQHGFHQAEILPAAAAAQGGEEDEGGADSTLEDAGRDERDYVRGRLREELSREPTEDEINEWLRQHTEGY